VVVDAHEGHLPADASGFPAAVAVDGMADAVNADETLGIDMQEVSWIRKLVALGRTELLVHAPDAAEAQGLEMLGDGGGRDARVEGDFLSRATATPQLLDAPQQTFRGSYRNRARP
jgi:hypothetical protein